MKVPYKHQDHWRYKELKDFEVEPNVTVGALLDEIKALKQCVVEMTELLQEKVILDETEYIAEVDNRLERIHAKKIYPNIDGNVTRMKIKDGRVVVDNRKVIL